jgi:hypothetical protein
LWRTEGRKGLSHPGWLLALLVLSLLPFRPSPVLPTVVSANQSEQHETPDEKLFEQAKLHASLPRLRRLRLLPRTSEAWPLIKLERVPSVPLKSLVHEDPRHSLLPRWTAPPEPDAHA